MPLKNDKNLPYGFLNPLNSQYGSGKSSYTDVNEFSFIQSLKEVVRERYENDFLSNNTQFKAIVLRVLDNDTFAGSPQMDALNTESGISTNISRIIAKIPELHAHLPDSSDEDDLLILGMYPVFEGPKSETAPVPGDIVAVTFQNIYNQSGPIYLGPITGEGSLSNLSSDKNISNSDGTEYILGKLEINNEQLFVGYENNNIIKQIVIHESVTSSTKKTIDVLRAKTEKAPNGLGVHFIIDEDAVITKCLPLNLSTIHADGNGTNHNPISIGIEIVNKYLGNRADSDDKVIDADWAHGGKYIVPKKNQLEKCWQLLKELTAGSHPEIPTARYGLKLEFPAISLTKTSKSNPLLPLVQNNNLKSYDFKWGRVGGLNDATGIMCHCRWDHSDGLFIEHYCFARFIGYDVDASYTETLKNAQLAKGVSGSPTRVTTIKKIK